MYTATRKLEGSRPNRDQLIIGLNSVLGEEVKTASVGSSISVQISKYNSAVA